MSEDPIRYRNPDVVHHVTNAIRAVGGTITTDVLTTIAHDYGRRLAYPETTIDRTIEDLHHYGIIRYGKGAKTIRLTTLGEAWLNADFTTITVLTPSIINGLAHPRLKTWSQYQDPELDNFDLDLEHPSPLDTPTPHGANPFA
jgi:hypothetical protein